jgi:sugar/nucleoside kinase (ribokinase family)
VLRWGPRVVVVKQGEYGAALVTTDSFFALPAYPLETVIDPTGAGDTFAGGLLGFIARHTDGMPSEDDLRRAMVYGTALASFNVEDFGTDRVVALTSQEIRERTEALHRITTFDHAAAELVGT